MKRLLEWFRGPLPKSLWEMFPKRKPAPPGLDRLYVLRIDFPLNQESAQRLESGIKPLRDKYGIDLFVLEPGMTISRFDDV